MSYSRVLFSKEQLIKANRAHVATQCEKYDSRKESNLQQKKKKKEMKTCFRQNVLQIEQLIGCISAYKSKMTFIGLDIEADKSRMYSELRVMMAGLYADINVEFFGVVATTIIDSKENLSQDDITNIKQTIKKEKDMINKGKNRVHEKVKDMRQNYSNIVVNGTGAGSGRNTDSVLNTN